MEGIALRSKMPRIAFCWTSETKLAGAVLPQILTSRTQCKRVLRSFKKTNGLDEVHATIPVETLVRMSKDMRRARVMKGTLA
jgi:hypothetical protein